MSKFKKTRGNEREWEKQNNKEGKVKFCATRSERPLGHQCLRDADVYEPLLFLFSRERIYSGGIYVGVCPCADVHFRVCVQTSILTCGLGEFPGVRISLRKHNHKIFHNTNCCTRKIFKICTSSWTFFILSLMFKFVENSKVKLYEIFFEYLVLHCFP